MLLEPELRARLDRFAVTSRRRIRGAWGGGHRSVRLGESLDFADYREYNPGDDFRRIDYNLWARLGVVLIRLFEAEEELPLRVIVDTSLSMDFGRKLETAKRLAGMIAYLGLTSGERVRMATVPTGERPALQGPWARHVSRWPQVEHWIESLEPEGGTDLVGAARLVASAGATRGPSVLISDLMADGWEQSIDLIGAAGGGVVVHVLSPSELDPDFAGDLTLRDRETGSEVPVSVDSRAVERYRERLEAFLDAAVLRSRRAGMTYLLARADDTAADVVLAGLVTAGDLR